ncbi:MAG: alpha/beta hydrolase family protein, partial [Thermoanaerobaculia bacterium]
MPRSPMQFSIASDEGLPIRGDFHAPQHPRALVLAIHGFKGFKDWGFFPWLAEYLCNSGFAICRFNMSRSGIGDDPESFDRLDLFAGDTYSIQLADLAAVTRHAQSHFPGLPTFLLGHSRGGGIAILGAYDVPGLSGVITWSSIGQTDSWDDATKRKWHADGFLDIVNSRTNQVMRMSPAILDDYERNAGRLDIRAAIGRIDVPMMLIHGGRDESVPVEASRDLAKSAREANLIVIGEASHTYNAIHPLVNVPAALSLAALVTAHFIS